MQPVEIAGHFVGAIEDATEVEDEHVIGGTGAGVVEDALEGGVEVEGTVQQSAADEVARENAIGEVTGSAARHGASAVKVTSDGTGEVADGAVDEFGFGDEGLGDFAPEGTVELECEAAY